VVPSKGFGFKKGDYGQTRWLFYRPSTEPSPGGSPQRIG
jgi:hypothetical protein